MAGLPGRGLLFSANTMNIPTIGQPQPKLETGVTFNARPQGDKVALQMVSTLILEPEQAAQLVSVINLAIQSAVSARVVAMAPSILQMNGNRPA